MRGLAHATTGLLNVSVLLFVLLMPTPAWTAGERDPELAVYEQSVESLRALLEANQQNPDVLSSLSEDAARLIARLQRCVRDKEKHVLSVEGNLNALGEPVPDESALVGEQRSNFKNELTQVKSELATCRVLLEGALTTSVDIRTRSRQIIQQKLLARGNNLLSLAHANLSDTTAWLDYSANLLEQYRGLLALGSDRLLYLILAMSLALLPGLASRNLLLRWGSSRTDNDFTSILVQSLNVALSRYLPWLLATVTGSIYFLIVPEKPDDFRFWADVIYSLTVFLMFMLGVRVLLYPLQQLPSPLLLPRELAQAMARRLRVLGLLCLFGFVYYASLEVLHLPADAQQFARGVFLSLFVLNLLWFVWLLGYLPGVEALSRRIRVVLALFLLGALAAEWLGYRELSSYLLYGVVGTTVLTTSAWILHVMLSELASGLDRGKFAWQRQLRKAVGLDDKQSFPGLSTLRFLLVLGIWTGFALLMMKLWGVPDALLQRLYIGFSSGFQIAGLHITPSKLIIALLIFALLLQVSSRIKETLEKRWLPASKLDHGAREATATIFGYAGFMVAVLITLSAAGLDLGKLAIVAGALSVGIGFGLQNIVNNFVSGLILLFERPISTGDFVTVGETEGFVRRISIRSTEIETLDRRSVIVPNSDLISGRVTNWIRNDTYGRVMLEIGVAYGSNLKQVTEILSEIATGHPDVINNSQTQPSVYCTSFGDSSINFRVYVVVGNFRQRLQVAHDINLQIAEAFAAQGIEIPFPQRVIHTVPTENNSADKD
jgi:potassium-dependent mechanosensitive channel